MPATRYILSTILLCLPLYAHATTVERCEDAAGNITYTSLGCPVGHSMRLQEAFNAAPGTEPGLLPPASPSTQSFAPRELVVVGGQDDGCGNRLSREQRRKAIINQHTLAGMTTRDVESALGRPDKVVSRNGETRYVYNEKKGRSSQVTFDENGCVKGKR